MMSRHPAPAARSAAAALLIMVAASPALPAQAPLSAPGMKSPSTAFLLSLGATAVPIIMLRNDQGSSAGLFVFAVLAGPALGHFYAGQPGRAVAGVAIRAGILVLTAAAAQGGCSNEDFICIPPAVVMGGLAELAAMAVDIATAPSSAHKTNQMRAAMFITPLPGGEHARLGIGMRMVF
jgi:hypothetical protein